MAPIFASRDACSDPLKPDDCKQFVLFFCVKENQQFYFYILLTTKVSNTEWLKWIVVSVDST